MTIDDATMRVAHDAFMGVARRWDARELPGGGGWLATEKTDAPLNGEPLALSTKARRFHSRDEFKFWLRDNALRAMIEAVDQHRGKPNGKSTR